MPFFNGVIKALGKRINYDAVVNYAGNSFAKDSWEMIQNANPIIKSRKLDKGTAQLFSNIKVMKSEDFEEDWMKDFKEGKHEKPDS